MDSTWHELKGTFNVLCSLVKPIKGKKVRHRTDNQNVVRALTNGSKKQHLQAVTMDIFKSMGWTYSIAVVRDVVHDSWHSHCALRSIACIFKSATSNLG